MELTRAYLDRIEALDGVLRAFLTVCADQALEDAARSDVDLRRSGPRSELHGIPIAIKDLFDTAGVPTVANSKVWAGRIPSQPAWVALRLDDAGAVLLGKLQMNEFAIGPVAEDDF